MQKLECHKIFEGCEGIVEAETTDEVLAQAAPHVRDVHGLATLDPETVEAVKAAIETR